MKKRIFTWKQDGEFQYCKKAGLFFGQIEDMGIDGFECMAGRVNIFGEIDTSESARVHKINLDSARKYIEQQANKLIDKIAK